MASGRLSSTSSSDSDEEYDATIQYSGFEKRNQPFPSKRSRSSSDSEDESSRKKQKGGVIDFKDATAREQKSNLSMDDMQKLGNYSTFSSKMMSKMGYEPGTGLGKKGQGRVNIVPMSNQRARRGLGLKLKSMQTEVIVDWTDEKPPSATEVVEWIPSYNSAIPTLDELEDWEQIGKKKLVIDDETLFCDEKILQTMLSCKSVFDDLEGQELRNARMRSNPYETIRGVIFLNRAAMKMANMDCCFDFMFTKPQNVLPNELLYFADVCAGPGGFSEYVLWRRKWRAKGYGFTLKGDNDFKLENFFAAHSEFFEPHYGVGGKDGDGDIMKSSNLEEFQNFVLDNTEEKGVHFVMGDGGFSVEGQENIQEILTKQLLLCQFACALSVVRVGGHFLCKTFDLFTPFSVGLIYLLRIAFHRVTLFKPVTSRPANSERYVVCEGYRDADRIIYQYLIGVNDTINELRQNEKDKDVKEVVPLEMILDDKEFFEYVKTSNERIATEQAKALAKIHAYAKDRNLMETRQSEVREECLKRWGIPDQVRVAPRRTDAASLFHKLTGLDSPSAWLRHEPEYLNRDSLSKLERVYDYRCFASGSRPSIIISMGGARIFRWNDRAQRWNSVSDVKCRIPRDTILEVETVAELKGEGKGQHRVQALHVIDVMVLAGDNILAKNYNERIQFASVFVKAISQPTYPSLNVVRMKEVYRLEEVQQLFDKLSLKRIKGGGQNDRACYDISGTKFSFVPTGVTFIKFTKDPWSIAFSRSAKRKYFYNCATKQSLFDCPSDSCASYQLCAQSRIFWRWDEKTKVHPNQSDQRPDLLSSDQLSEFIRLYVHK